MIKDIEETKLEYQCM